MYDPGDLPQRKGGVTDSKNNQTHRSLRRGVSLRHMAAVDPNNGSDGTAGTLRADGDRSQTPEPE